MKYRGRTRFGLGASLLVVAQMVNAQSLSLSSADTSELAAGKRP